MSGTRIFSRDQIENRIASGDTLVIFEGHVLRLNAWQNVHPGGRLVIQHMVGRDASDELSISHDLKILSTMKRWSIGRVEGEWLNFIPPVQGGIFRRDTEMGGENTHAVQGKVDVISDAVSTVNTTTCDQATSCTSVEIKPGLAATETTIVYTKKNDTEGALPPQATKGYRLEPAPDSYTATAIQEAIDADIAKYPSLDVATQRDISLKFRALHQRVRDEGYYNCRFSEYAKELARYSALFACFVFCLRHGWYVPSAISLGLFWQQIMFTAHDAGHRGITHNYVIDSLIGIFIGNFCCGLSIGWWKSSHNVHHFVTNDPVHDPDIQNIPLFSTSPAFFSSIKSSYYDGFQFIWNSVADYTVAYQKYTYYPIMAVARFNLYILSWLHLISPRSIKKGTAAWIRPVESIATACYVYMFFYVLLCRIIPTWWDAAVFLLVSHVATLPLHVQITLSHWGASTSDLGPTEAFAQRQLRTTLDVDCPEWLDFFHGGLQFQAVHHLFPRVPRHNLRKLQKLVREFCADTGIDYQILGFADGNKHILSHLQQVTDQAKMLSACSSHMAATANLSLPKI